ncbi:hypothetical protein C5B28_13510, partial [Neisseria gonorrhoeae]
MWQARRWRGSSRHRGYGSHPNQRLGRRVLLPRSRFDCRHARPRYRHRRKQHTGRCRLCPRTGKNRCG